MNEWIEKARAQLAESRLNRACRECSGPLPTPGRGRPRVVCQPCADQKVLSRLSGVEMRACAHCGHEFEPTGPNHRFCSTGCREEAYVPKKGERYCLHCLKPIEGHSRNYCDRYCWKGVKYRLVELKPLECPECKTTFMPKTGGKHIYCSMKCGKRARNRVRTAWRKTVIRSGEKIKDVDVFVRDGWICQICKEPVEAGRYGHVDPRAPTVDHIIPFTKGGEHTWANVQLAHRGCNMEKSDKVESH